MVFATIAAPCSVNAHLRAGTASLTLLLAASGSCGIGHVRYPTAGSLTAQEAQPFFVNSPLGIYLIHNGNLTNPAPLRARLSSSQSFFSRHLRTDSDSEVGADLIAQEHLSRGRVGPFCA